MKNIYFRNQITGQCYSKDANKIESFFKKKFAAEEVYVSLLIHSRGKEFNVSIKGGSLTSKILLRNIVINKINGKFTHNLYYYVDRVFKEFDNLGDCLKDIYKGYKQVLKKISKELIN